MLTGELRILGSWYEKLIIRARCKFRMSQSKIKAHKTSGPWKTLVKKIKFEIVSPIF